MLRKLQHKLGGVRETPDVSTIASVSHRDPICVERWMAANCRRHLLSRAWRIAYSVLPASLDAYLAQLGDA